MNENCLIGIVGRSPARTANKPLFPSLTEQYCPMPLLTLSAVKGEWYSKRQTPPGLLCRREKLDGSWFQYLARVKSCLGDCYKLGASNNHCQKLNLLVAALCGNQWIQSHASDMLKEKGKKLVTVSFSLRTRK